MGYIIWPCSIYRAILTTGPSYLTKCTLCIGDTSKRTFLRDCILFVISHPPQDAFKKSFVEGLKIISLKVLKVFFQKSKQYFVESPKSISLKVPTRQVKNTSLKVSKMFRQAGCRGKSRTNDLSLYCSAPQLRSSKHDN